MTDSVTPNPKRLDRMRERQRVMSELWHSGMTPEEVEHELHRQFPETHRKRIVRFEINGIPALEFRGPSDWKVIGL